MKLLLFVNVNVNVVIVVVAVVDDLNYVDVGYAVIVARIL